MFGPADTAIAVGLAFEDRCNDGVYRPHPTRGLVEGAALLPFKQGATKLLIAPPGCGGVADPEPTLATGVGVRDGALGITATCLTLGPNGKAVPLGVGLRYEVGRWNQPDPARPGLYARPGSLDLAPFWFASWSRRIHGEFPEWDTQPWSVDALPSRFELVLEDYSIYTFEQSGSSRRYDQPGASPNAAVAFAEVVERSDPDACTSSGDPSRLAANNDVIVHYADGTRDLFSGRDLTFKAHIDNFQNYLVVTHGMQSGSAPSCGGDDAAIGVKRIASYPAYADEPLMWIDLEHEYVELTHPTAPGGALGLWRLRSILDSVGREVSVEYDASAPDRITRITEFPGRASAQIYTFGYDNLGVVNNISLPAPSGDASNVIEIEHAHPSSLAAGGLSRVLSQTRTVAGANATTSFEWSSGASYDLEVSYPGGHFQRFGHEQPQGQSAEPLLAPSRDDNRVTAAYNVDATSNPAQTAYDPISGFVTEKCDQLSPGPSGNPASPGPRCGGYVYDERFDLIAMVSRNEGGGSVEAELDYEVFAPGNDHRLANYRGPEGDLTSYTYAVADTWLDDSIATVELSSSRDALGNTTKYQWCAGTSTCPRGLIAKLVSPVEGETLFVYDAELGTPLLRKNPDETQQRLAYDLRGCLLESDDQRGVKTRYEYDELGDCMPERSIRNPDGDPEILTEHEYDPARLPRRRSVDVGGGWSNSDAVHEFEYQVVDMSGRRQATLERSGGQGGEFLVELAYRYDAFGQLIERKEPSMDRTTTMAYAYLGSGGAEVTLGRSDVGASKLEQYDPAGMLVRAVDERNVTDEYVYSSNSGRLIEERSGEGEAQMVMTYAYDDDGLVRARTSPDESTLYEYDAARRPQRSSTNGVTDEVTLDAAGRPVARRRLEGGAPVAELQYTYDKGGKGSRVKTMSSLADGGGDPLTTTNYYETESTSWGACQATSPGECYETIRVETPRDVGGSNSFRELGYDELGRLSEVTLLGVGSSDGATFEYTYDHLDCVREIVGGGRTQLFDCDALGRTIAETEWATRSWEFYADGSVKMLEDFNGTQTYHDLDASGWRVGRVRYENEPEEIVAADDVTFTYFANDLVATMSDGAGLTEYAYDSRNRLIALTVTPSHQGGVPRTLSYSYQPNSDRLAAVDYWGQGTVSYGYDEAGRIAELTPFAGATQTFEYLEDGRVRSMSSAGTSIELVYDPLRRLQRLHFSGGPTPGAGPNLLTLDYDAPGLPGRDENGNIRGILERWLDEPGLAHEFGYDAADRLETIELPPLDPMNWSSAKQAFADGNEYDNRGNATRMMGTDLSFDTSDRVTTEGYAYDQNGNLVCYGDDAACHCFNGIQDDDEVDVDCGGTDCACCLELGPPVPPAFVGTACPNAGSEVDWAALDAERAAYHNPSQLEFGIEIPYDPGGGCGSISVQLPTPCGDGYADYEMFRMGGAVATTIIPFIGANWVHNPGYYAEGMNDPFFDHPAKQGIVACQGQGNMCAIGNYGDGLSDYSLEPCDLARQDNAPAPMQPGPGLYDGKIRAFPVYERGAPDLQYPPGYQLCYDVIDFHAQGGAPFGTCQNDNNEHGSIYVYMRGAGCL